VSYLITTLNRVEFLARTLENVREFIEKEDELIVVDGGSSDGTIELVAKNRDLVSQFVSEPDSGEGHAFNKGLFLARGRLLKPITDDDYFYPEAMKRVVAEMEADPDIDAIQCGGEVWSLEGVAPRFLGFRSLPAGIEPTARAIYDHAHIGLGIIIRRAALMRTGGVSNEYVSVDGDLTCRLVECRCRLKYLDVNLYRWHVHPHSGFNKQKAMDRDRLLIDLRLGKWSDVVSRDPERTAELLFECPSSRDRALFSALWIGGLLARSPLWRIASPVSRALRAAKRAAQFLRFQRVAELQVPRSEKTWTGRLT